MAMTLSMTDWSFLKKGDDVPAFYRQVAAMGYVASELTGKENRQAARDAGLKLINRHGPTGWNRTTNHAKCLEDIRAAMADLTAAQIPSMLVFAGNREGQADDVSIENCVIGLRQAASLAEEAGKMLLLEVFNKYDHKDYAADSSSFAYEVVTKVGSKNLLVLYDIYHMRKMEEDIERTLFDHLDLVGHVHIAKPPDRKCAIDDESVRLIKLLSRSAYKGVLGAEWLADNSIEELKMFADKVKSLG